VIYNEPTPIALLTRLRPSVYAKGGDDDMSKLAESALVRGWGGHVLALPFVDVLSTASLMDRLRASSRVAPAES
jgi:bifunctional ADP-heptose synthase (sugar kinase/adenylyltransferase)